MENIENIEKKGRQREAKYKILTIWTALKKTKLREGRGKPSIR